MNSPKHSVVWFEIPVKDLSRAETFYGAVLGITFERAEMGPSKMSIFPSLGAAEGEFVVHGALLQSEGYEPSDQGPVLYLNGGKDLSEPLSRVVAAGGTILQDKMSIGEHGFCAVFKDSEGNRLALHSPS